MATLTHDVVRPAAEARPDRRAAAAYMDPYLAGVGLGLVLLAAFVLMGRGLGASGAFSATVAWLVSLVAPAHAAGSEYLSPYLAWGHPLKAWLVFEVLGVFAGALVSGLLAHRVRLGIEKGPRASNRSRLLLAFLGGGLMAVGADLARGCTSGQALTGGSLLNLGSWVFMLCVFGGAYAVAYFLRRQWR
ncbi:MAG TPA: YeeE/YedE thiosulfate transporter family protein [Vicinamibacteria bacterium]|nr:YeeE/YedE thiosulfate transporter family protein [Vicinamibacteria bacterium]